MKTLLLAILLTASCAGADDGIVSVDDVLIVIEPHRPRVECVLQTPTSCGCSMAECTKEALLEATRQCNILRGFGPNIVVE